MLQLAHPEVAQLKLGGLWPQVCYCSFADPKWAPESVVRPLLFIIRPTNARMRHKAVFKVGPDAGPKRSRVQLGQKYLRPRRHSPFQGAPQAPGNTPPEEHKSRGDGAMRPEEFSNADAHSAECDPTTGEERSDL